MAFKSQFTGIDLRNLAKQIIGDAELEDLQLAQGKITPADLPYYRPAVQSMRTGRARGLEDLSGVLTRGGVTGPSFAKAIEDYGEGTKDQEVDVYNSLLGRVEEGRDRAERIRKQIQGEFMQYQAAHKAREAAGGGGIENIAAIAKPISGGIAGIIKPFMGGAAPVAGGAGCPCYIFREGNEGHLEESIRKYRDAHFLPDSWVSRGYKKMASWLVPMMRKSKVMKKAVKLIMLDPLARVARWTEGKDKWGWLFIPVGYFWTFVWAESARVGAILDRSKGEIVAIP